MSDKNHIIESREDPLSALMNSQTSSQMEKALFDLAQILYKKDHIDMLTELSNRELQTYSVVQLRLKLLGLDHLNEAIQQKKIDKVSHGRKGRKDLVGIISNAMNFQAQKSIMSRITGLGKNL